MYYPPVCKYLTLRSLLTDPLPALRNMLFAERDLETHCHELTGRRWERLGGCISCALSYGMDICTTLCVPLLSFRDEWYVSMNPYPPLIRRPCHRWPRKKERMEVGECDEGGMRSECGLWCGGSGCAIFPVPVVKCVTAVQRMRPVEEGMPLLCRQIGGMSALLWSLKPRTDTFPSGGPLCTRPDISSSRASAIAMTSPHALNVFPLPSLHHQERFLCLFFHIQVMSFVKVHIPDHRPSSSSISSTTLAARSDFENFACPSSRVMRQCCV